VILRTLSDEWKTVVVMEHRGRRGKRGHRVLFFGIDYAAQAIAQMFNMEIDQQANLATRKAEV
jgi:hypothetical protein